MGHQQSVGLGVKGLRKGPEGQVSATAASPAIFPSLRIFQIPGWIFHLNLWIHCPSYIGIFTLDLLQRSSVSC